MHEYASEEDAAADALFRPMTIREVMERTGRSRRTVSRWITDGRLRAVDLDGVRMVIEREVIESESERRAAAEASREHLAERRRRDPGTATD